MWRHVCLLALLWAGCKKQEEPPKGDDSDEPSPPDVPDPTDGPLPKLPLSCPDETPEAGVAGGMGIDRFAFDWVWDEELDIGWAGPFYLQAAEDLTGIAFTANGGNFKTAIGLLSLDGRVAMDWTGESSWDSTRRARLREGDTADTGPWDTAGYPVLSGFYAAPFYHGPDVTGTMVLPMNDDSIPPAGCVAVMPLVMEVEARGSSGELVVVSKRTPMTERRLDLNIVVLEGTEISDEEIDVALARMRELYDDGNALTIDEVIRHDVTIPTAPFVDESGAGVEALRALPLSDSTAEAMSLFFIEDFVGSAGTLGIAAGIPGPMGVTETAGSGVIVAVDGHRADDGTLDTRTMGETMAHEVGHQLGLFHTSESGGDSFDPIDDTPECQATTYDSDADSEVSAAECLEADGRNFMFWAAGDEAQDQVTAGQAAVLVRSPIAH